MRGYKSACPVPVVHGKRLNRQALAVKISGRVIAVVSVCAIKDALPFFKQDYCSEAETELSQPMFKEVVDRLTFLFNVGLGYSLLSRSAGTLSGGVAQRIRCATQIGSNLSGELYVQSVPSMWCHQRDNDRLMSSQ